MPYEPTFSYPAILDTDIIQAFVRKISGLTTDTFMTQKLMENGQLARGSSIQYRNLTWTPFIDYSLTFEEIDNGGTMEVTVTITPTPVGSTGDKGSLWFTEGSTRPILPNNSYNKKYRTNYDGSYSIPNLGTTEIYIYLPNFPNSPQNHNLTASPGSQCTIKFIDEDNNVVSFIGKYGQFNAGSQISGTDKSSNYNNYITDNNWIRLSPLSNDHNGSFGYTITNGVTNGYVNQLTQLKKDFLNVIEINGWKNYTANLAKLLFAIFTKKHLAANMYVGNQWIWMYTSMRTVIQNTSENDINVSWNTTLQNQTYAKFNSWSGQNVPDTHPYGKYLEINGWTLHDIVYKLTPGDYNTNNDYDNLQYEANGNIYTVTFQRLLVYLSAFFSNNNSSLNSAKQSIGLFRGLPYGYTQSTNPIVTVPSNQINKLVNIDVDLPYCLAIGGNGLYDCTECMYHRKRYDTDSVDRNAIVGLEENTIYSLRKVRDNTKIQILTQVLDVHGDLTVGDEIANYLGTHKTSMVSDDGLKIIIPKGSVTEKPADEFWSIKLKNVYIFANLYTEISRSIKSVEIVDTNLELTLDENFNSPAIPRAALTGSTYTLEKVIPISGGDENNGLTGVIRTKGQITNNSLNIDAPYNYSGQPYQYYVDPKYPSTSISGLTPNKIYFTIKNSDGTWSLSDKLYGDPISISGGSVGNIFLWLKLQNIKSPNSSGHIDNNNNVSNILEDQQFSSDYDRIQAGINGTMNYKDFLYHPQVTSLVNSVFGSNGIVGNPPTITRNNVTIYCNIDSETETTFSVYSTYNDAINRTNPLDITTSKVTEVMEDGSPREIKSYYLNCYDNLDIRFVGGFVTDSRINNNMCDIYWSRNQSTDTITHTVTNWSDNTGLWWYTSGNVFNQNASNTQFDFVKPYYIRPGENEGSKDYTTHNNRPYNYTGAQHYGDHGYEYGAGFDINGFDLYNFWKGNKIPDDDGNMLKLFYVHAKGKQNYSSQWGGFRLVVSHRPTGEYAEMPTVTTEPVQPTGAAEVLAAVSDIGYDATVTTGANEKVAEISAESTDAEATTTITDALKLFSNDNTTFQKQEFTKTKKRTVLRNLMKQIVNKVSDGKFKMAGEDGKKEFLKFISIDSVNKVEIEKKIKPNIEIIKPGQTVQLDTNDASLYSPFENGESVTFTDTITNKEFTMGKSGNKYTLTVAPTTGGTHVIPPKFRDIADVEGQIYVYVDNDNNRETTFIWGSGTATANDLPPAETDPDDVGGVYTDGGYQGGAVGDPYITTLSGITYKMNNFTGNARMIQGMYQNKLFTLNVQTQLLTVDEIHELIAWRTQYMDSCAFNNNSEFSQFPAYFKKLFACWGDQWFIINMNTLEIEESNYQVNKIVQEKYVQEYPWSTNSSLAKEASITIGQMNLIINSYRNKDIRNGFYLKNTKLLTNRSGALEHTIFTKDMKRRSLKSLIPIKQKTNRVSHKYVEEQYIEEHTSKSCVVKHPVF
tara:strand:+ start:845 stop:5287 length:4443 start_codon:yes stop_codon:yes gene_type:complete